MTESTARRHWLATVAQRAGLSLSEGAGPTSDADLESAWKNVAAAVGFTERELAARIAQHLHLPLADVGSGDAAAVAVLPEKVAYKYGVFPLKLTDRTLTVATASPVDPTALRAIEFASGRNVEFEVSPPQAVLEAIHAHYAPDQLVEHLLHHHEGLATSEIRVVEQFEAGEISEFEAAVEPVVRLTNVILSEAVRRGASDVHIEPAQGDGQVRLRVDGVLESFMRLPLPALVRVVSRIKVMSQLDIADRIRPQDGGIRIQVGTTQYDMRVSTVPAQDGEKCVIRLLSPTATFSLSTLAYPAVEEAALKAFLGYRDGIVLVTGPTGSGKTTTLYGMVKELAVGELNVSTVEDPIEYNLPGVTQVQVATKRKVTFASALRALLRQDPDVILVGEIRDPETAQTAVRASMTGHLVLSTLHTNDAASVVPRLRDLGVDPSDLASSLRGVIAQRLVRRICLGCASAVAGPDDLSPRELRLADLYEVEPPRLGVGCDLCRGAGFKDRLPVLEVLTVTPEIQDLVAKGASTADIRAAGRRAGMRSMHDVAMELVRNGETTLREVERVGLTGERSQQAQVPHAVTEHGEVPVDPDLTGRSVAVLPFVNVQGGEHDDYFSDGITEDIIVALNRIEGVRALTRHSVARFRNSPKSIREIGKELAASTVLEGSVRRTEGRVRIVAQLFDVATDEVLWGETYDRDLEDVFWVQSDVAQRIAVALEAELSSEERGRVEQKPTEDLAAYVTFLRGRHFWNQRTAEGIRRGITFFEKAVELDGDFVLALAGLADSYVTLGMYEAEPPAEVMPLARRMAEQALAADPEMAEALTALACVRSVYEWQWAEAEALFKKAMKADARYPTAPHWYAVNLLAPIQRFEDARHYLERSLQLDPSNLVIKVSAGIISYYEGDHERAVEECRAVLEAEQDFAVAHYFLGQASEQLGRLGEARDALERAATLSGGSAESVSAMGHLLATSDDEAGAREKLAELLARAEQSYVSPSLVAQVHAGLGETEQALDWLDQALEKRTPQVAWLGVRPTFNALRETPRFQELIASVSFPALESAAD